MRNLIISFLTVLLVSFSVCEAQQNQQGINTTQQSTATPITPIKQADVKPNEQGTKQADVKPNGVVENSTQGISKNETVTAHQNSSTQAVITAITEVPASVQTETKQNASKADINNNVPTGKAEEPATQKTSENVAPTKQTMTDGTKPTETTVKAVNDTKTGGKDKSDATVPKNETVMSTEAPEAKQVLATRAFDGASFVGGIVLTLGLLAISFVGFKYYKNLTKENYHIL